MASKPAAETKSEAVLTWRVHLAREQPRRAIAAILIILSATIFIAVLSGNPFWPLITFATLVLSLNDFFLPVRYTMNERGIEAAGPASRSFLAWSDVRRFYLAEEGLKISPLEKASRLEAYRGVFLRCSGETRERVIELVRRQIDQNGENPIPVPQD